MSLLPVQQEDIITITGEHFSDVETDLSVTIGGKRAEVVEAGVGSIRVKVPGCYL